MCRLVRRHSPRSQIVVGGHVTAIPGIESMIDADRIVKGEGIAVYIRFYDAKGAFLNTQELKNQINVPVRRGDTEWKAFSKRGVAPANAVKVEVWVHSFTKNVVLSEADLSSLYRIGDGGLSPLTGPMTREEWEKTRR